LDKEESMAEVEHIGEAVDASGSSLKDTLLATHRDMKASREMGVSAGVGLPGIVRGKMGLTGRTLRSSDRQSGREWAQNTELHGWLLIRLTLTLEIREINE
jgi:hypothetical protein